MALIVGFALVILSLAVVVFPFAAARSNRRQTDQKGDTSDPRIDTPELEEIYAAIETLRLEHQLGNVPRNLYEEQLEAYRLQAARVLRQIDEAGSDDPGILLEQEILRARSNLPNPESRPDE
ncbi:MAG: hypothetical protein BZY88_13845 [SAR202 cluster bacterium Io17-Chloro-G9]|nr:MAG: hypothetical protein BZY88_13845 [SAR202 cluster bacterium Io17-Chloro-G9]